MPRARAKTRPASPADAAAYLAEDRSFCGQPKTRSHSITAPQRGAMRSTPVSPPATQSRRFSPARLAGRALRRTDPS
jgi:hypothetical protein